MDICPKSIRCRGNVLRGKFIVIEAYFMKQTNQKNSNNLNAQIKELEKENSQVNSTKHLQRQTLMIFIIISKNWRRKGTFKLILQDISLIPKSDTTNIKPENYINIPDTLSCKNLKLAQPCKSTVLL